MNYLRFKLEEEDLKGSAWSEGAVCLMTVSQPTSHQETEHIRQSQS